MLTVWPKLSPILLGSLTKYRGINVTVLGAAITRNALGAGRGTEVLQWAQISALGTNTCGAK